MIFDSALALAVDAGMTYTGGEKHLGNFRDVEYARLRTISPSHSPSHSPPQPYEDLESSAYDFQCRDIFDIALGKSGVHMQNIRRFYRRLDAAMTEETMVRCDVFWSVYTMTFAIDWTVPQEASVISERLYQRYAAYKQIRGEEPEPYEICMVHYPPEMAMMSSLFKPILSFETIFDSALALAVDAGMTYTGEERHLGSFRDVEYARLRVISPSHTHRSQKDLENPAYDFQCRDVFDTASGRAGMYAAHIAYFYRHLNVGWDEDAIFRRDAFWDVFAQTFAIDWSVPHEKTLIEERLYRRYVAYKQIRGENPEPYDACMTNYPPEMTNMIALFKPQVIIDSCEKGVKRPRNRGTSWEHTSEEVRRAECDTFLRAFASVNHSLTEDESEALRRMCRDMVVECRYRAKNAMKHPKTEANIKRSEAPLLRYSHPFITEDVVAAVLSTLGKKKDVENGRYAPSRLSCFCCILYVHSIHPDLWPSAQHFPRPVKRSSV